MDYPMGDVILLHPGDSFDHAKVNVRFMPDGEQIGASLTDGSPIEPLHATFSVVLEKLGEQTAHAFYHPLTMQGICTLERVGGVLPVREIDLSGDENLRPMVIDVSDAVAAGVDDKGRLIEELPDSTRITHKDNGHVELDIPEDKVPPAFRKPKP